ncbi:MAG: DEAD/DEAH box helicase family protein [Candidatus Competibacteraceae bacterium]
MSDLILRIAVPSPLDRTFDYLPPPGCDLATLQPGLRVRVPFGRRHVVGFLLELGTDTTLNPTALRPAQAVLDTEAVLPADVLALLRWAQRYYHHPPGEVFATALPTLLRQGESTELPAPAPLWQITAAGRAALATGPSRAPVQRLLLDYLARCPDGADADTLRAVVRDSTATLRALRAKNWAEPLARPTAILAETACAPRPPPALNAAQAAAVTSVTAELENHFQVFLLEGVTGSGKTEVYLRLIEAVLASDRQALVLTPEIGLTPQLLARFRERLPGPLAVLHWSERSKTLECLAAGSRRSPGGGRLPARRYLRHCARRGFASPHRRREHDPSFKQQDGFRYHARDLAVVRGQQLRIRWYWVRPLRLWKAATTPSAAATACCNCRNRSAAARKAPIEILDVRRQPMAEGLSRPLLERMRIHLARSRQVLLFSATTRLRPDSALPQAAWLSQCHHCDARMTLHLRQRRLICHHCGDSQRWIPLPALR